MDDSELLRQYAQNRSEAAFTELVKRHLDVVFSAACRQVGGDVHRAKDVAQMVFTDLARKAPALTAHTALVGWLYTSTHFTAAKVRRNEQRRSAREKEAHAMNELLGSATDPADWERLRPVLDEAMLALKPRAREAVLLRFFEKRSFSDVGRHLGLGENAARMSVERALDKLRELLARRGITSSSAALSLALTQQAVTAAPTGMATAVTSGALGQAALTGSAGVGTALAHFMANTKLTLSASALAGLLAIGIWGVTETRGARTTANLAGLTQETAALTARSQEIEARLAALAATKPAPAAVVTALPAVEPAETKSDEYFRVALRDPVSIRLMAQLYRVNAARWYTALYWKLGWTAAQVAQFEAILDASTSEDLHQQAGGQVKGESLTLAPEIAAQLERVRAEFESRLRATFGDAVLQEFLAFERTSASRAVAEEIAGRVYFTATPLTAGQADELVRILGQHAAVGHSRALPPGAVNWEQVLAQAERVLAPAQLTALRTIRLKAEFEAKRAARFPEAKP
jgi:RNA polymerase sigma factor (sigma-70 family)